ncbi:MAG: ATP-binding protein [Oscillospiraceae bacterium]
MMTEISLNILDVAQNSVKAQAKLIEISVEADFSADRLTVKITDDGCGMDAQTVANVIDPFFTTRTTRKVGLGVPFFKLAAEAAGGRFSITSEPGKGTDVTAEFQLSHIDRMPLGNMPDTIHMLITLNTHIDFVYRYIIDGEGFTLDTREMREILGDAPLDEPEVSEYIRDFLRENTAQTDGGRTL